MTSKEYEKINSRFLDRIDFIPYLKFCASVSELRKLVADNMPIPITDIPRELQGYYFNFLNEPKFTEYLKKRYGDDWDFPEYVQIEHLIIQKSNS